MANANNTINIPEEAMQWLDEKMIHLQHGVWSNAPIFFHPHMFSGVDVDTAAFEMVCDLMENLVWLAPITI